MEESLKQNSRDASASLGMTEEKIKTKGTFLGVLALVLVCFAVFWVFFNKGGDGAARASDWYAVKLANEEIYYGRINDLSADPVVMSDVYYNYNQDEKEASEAGNIRLVKRGNETHGPAGTMNIPRAQVVYMESLSEDSKVLRAILENE